MSDFLTGLKESNNLTFTENGALTHKSTTSDLLDLFALGGAYRNRSDLDIVQLVNRAFYEDQLYTLKCLFYLRDIREGQGERRFFKTAIKFLAIDHTDAIRRNLKMIPIYGRWDDLYALVDTPLEDEMFRFMYEQVCLDLESKTPSLLGKWLKSENASSKETKMLAYKTRMAFNLTSKQYRKTLTHLRAKINVLETLMSENRWDEIEFDKIPSVAGLKYRNAFARRDVIKEKYREFAMNENSTVNAQAIYPYQCIHEVMKHAGWWGHRRLGDIDRAMINKYWDNLADYINEAEFNGIAVVDTSGSMSGTPIEVALSLGMYCAEKCSGPFANHFITFSHNPDLVELKGDDFCDKVINMNQADWEMNTDVAAVFDLLLNTAIRNNCTQDEIPQNIIIISDMEFDHCGGINVNATLFENIADKWQEHGYTMPKLIFWNVDARKNNIPMFDNGYVNFVSGFSPVLYEQILKNMSAYDVMMDKLNSARYKEIV